MRSPFDSYLLVAWCAAAIVAGGCGDGGGAAAREGRVRIDSLDSPALGVRKRYVVYLPREYQRDSLRRFPVAYYLHGAGENEWSWVRRGGIAEAADSLMNAGASPMIVVMPDGDDGYYTDWPDSARDAPRFAACRREHAALYFWREAARSYCVPRQRYGAYITHDLVGAVDGRYRTLADPRHRAIAGASMGGYGAVTLALKHPETWSVAGSHSGVLAPAGVTRETSRSWAAGLAQAYGGRWPYWSARFGVDSSTWAARDPCALARELAAHGTNHMPALRFDAGRSDPLAFQSRIFEYCLTALRVPHEYHESAGGHDWRYWRVHGAESLAWLSARVGSGR